jgi:carotenoid cleavage dioxygenase
MGGVRGFPDILEYSGLNRPRGEEYDIEALAVEGRIPPEVDGVFFRAVPDPVFPPFVEDGGAVLSADGMISAIRFGCDGVGAQMRYVRTARYEAERAAGKAIFGKYRNPFTDLPEAAGVDRTVANTTPVWHAGKLLMAKEDGRAYRVDPITLETIGRYDFGGLLKSETMTAHVRIDPETGELFFFGYEADGLASAKIAYCIADRSGCLISEQWFDGPYCSMMHDFAITRNHVLFPVYPTTCDLERLKQGGEHWVHEMETPSWVGVMPRYGKVNELRWYRGPDGVSCYHMMNAFEDDEGRIQFDQCLSDSNAFPFIQRASGLDIPPHRLNSRLARWTIDLAEGIDGIRETVIGPPGDFPVIPADRQGRPYDHGWMLTMDPAMQAPPLAGGPVGAMFNMLVRLDFTGRPPQELALPPAHCFSEPVHVPAAAAGHDGWLLTMVCRQLGPDEFEEAVWIVDGGNVAAGPVAKVHVPRRMRPQVHGWWVSSAQLAA